MNLILYKANSELDIIVDVFVLVMVFCACYCHILTYLFINKIVIEACENIAEKIRLRR